MTAPREWSELFVLRPIKKTLKSAAYFLSAFSVKTFLPAGEDSFQSGWRFPETDLFRREKEESTAACNTIDGGKN